MKTAFQNTAQCIHVWAQQTQAEGHCINVSFRGPSLYSYAAEIARFVTHNGKPAKLDTPQRQTVVLLTTERWSVTTSSHQSAAASAVRHHAVFHVGSLSASPRDNLNDYKRRIQEAAQTAKKAKGYKLSCIGSMLSLVKEANRYAKFYGLKTRFLWPADFDLQSEKSKGKVLREVMIRKANEQHEKRSRECSREWKEAQERFKAEQKEQFVAWLQGESIMFPHSFHEQGNDRLRIMGDNLQTSQGAECPIDHALRALPLIRAGREFIPNGHTIHLGPFHIDRIDAQGNVQAGCHNFRREEIERIATLLGHPLTVVSLA